MADTSESRELFNKIGAVVAAHPNSPTASASAAVALLHLAAVIHIAVEGLPSSKRLECDLIEAMVSAAASVIEDWKERN